jgi:hypothetical protein
MVTSLFATCQVLMMELMHRCYFYWLVMISTAHNWQLLRGGVAQRAQPVQSAG